MTSVSAGTLKLAEHHMYGSSRLGIINRNLDADQPKHTAENINQLGDTYLINFTRGNKLFEIANHLGNVMLTVTDKREPVPVSGNPSVIASYKADVMTAADYSPFGMTLPGRAYNNHWQKYRYGFNGKESDSEVNGPYNELDYGMRIYEPRLGRFLSVDPLTKSFPWNSPYSYAEGDPINYIDLDGLERTEERAVATPTPTKPKIDIKVDRDLLNGRNSGRVPDKSLVPKKVPLVNPFTRGGVLGIIWYTFTSPQDSYTDKTLYDRAKQEGFKNAPLNQTWAEEHHRSDYPEDVVDRDKDQDIVYRGGAFTKENFTPRPGKDDGEGPKSGLSTFRTAEQAVGDKGGKAQKIDLNVLRNFGFKITETDDGHVGIRAPTRQELKEWAATRGQKLHYRTVMVMAARIGENKIPKKDK
ncbi:MAG: RHS repeat-associated core domain-containing protein [Chitinophagaceae bacterium]|nr:RHS repeat-associated core domain-containing protein [Chitinophagaceae bacterium]